MRKQKQPLEKYLELGAKFRAFKTMSASVCIEAAKLTTKKDWRTLQNAVDKIAAFSSVLEDKMFKEYPNLSDEYINVFYGSTDRIPRNEVDADTVERAKEFCDTLF